MDALQTIFTRLVPTLSIFAVALLIEAVIPLRSQPRRTLGRLATNLWLMAITLALGMLLNAMLAAGALYLGSRHIGLFSLLGIDGALAFLLALLLLDAATYFIHVMLHSVPLFWRLHLIHHMDVAVDATTAYRQHPVEGVLRFATVAFTVISFGFPPEAAALYRLMGSLNSAIEHANIRLPRYMERLLILFWVTPDMHKMHHSRLRAETDSNYANLFSFMDRIFGTFTPTTRLSSLRYGIDGFDLPSQHSITAVLLLPFRRESGGRNLQPLQPSLKQPV